MKKFNRQIIGWIIFFTKSEYSDPFSLCRYELEKMNQACERIDSLWTELEIMLDIDTSEEK